MSAVNHITAPSHVLQPYLVPYALPSYLENKAQALQVQPYQHHSSRSAAAGKNVICYFANWSRYRPSDGVYVPENIPSELCTHVVYAFAKLDSKDFKIVLSDQQLEIAEGKA